MEAETGTTEAAVAQPSKKKARKASKKKVAKKPVAKAAKAPAKAKKPAQKRAKLERGDKTKFVLGIAREVKATDVVAQAKAAGIKLTEAYVYKVRALATKKKAVKKAARKAAKAAAKVAPKAPAKKPVRALAATAGGENTESFRDGVIRHYNSGTTSASAIIAALKSEGHDVSAPTKKSYIYTILSDFRKAGGKAPVAKKVAKPAKSTVTHLDEYRGRRGRPAAVRAPVTHPGDAEFEGMTVETARTVLDGLPSNLRSQVEALSGILGSATAVRAFMAINVRNQAIVHAS